MERAYEISFQIKVSLNNRVAKRGFSVLRWKLDMVVEK